jgi:glyoxylase-like metal-dependent hydrolase (beta-lactamase superfamily II)
MKPPEFTQYAIGDGVISVYNGGYWNTPYKWSDVVSIPEEMWRAKYGDQVDVHLDIQCLGFHISLPGVSIVVDSGPGTHDTQTEYPGVVYTHILDADKAVVQAGCDPATVTDVVISHLHWDHFAGLTYEAEGELKPVFPNARVWIGPDARAEKKRREQPESLLNKTLSLFERSGKLNLVTEKVNLAPGVDILPAPGETEGHCCVRVQSGHHVAFIMADLFHLDCEVENIDWGLTWHYDRELNVKSRQKLFGDAISDDARVFTSHVQGYGKLRKVSEMSYRIDWHLPSG